MEVAIGQNGSTPFQREVREWQHIDPNTGALLTGRLEADRWINGPLNKYGKVVDSQNFSQPNGTQHTQRKQLEVLQAKTSNGSMQVIRAQTVQTTSSRTSFQNKISSTNSNLSQTSNNLNKTLPSITLNGLSDNVNLKNILKTEPSLKLSNLMKSSGNNNLGNVSDDNSSNSGRISPHLTRPRRHNENINNNKTILNDSLARYDHQKQIQNKKPTMFDRNRVGGKVNENNYKNNNTSDLESFQNERETDLQRPRSASIDDLSSDWTETQDDENEKPHDWQRVSKIRRSFQFPKISPSKPSRPIDLPENSVSVSKIREELENGRRLNTAMRNNHIDLAALDNILNNSSDSDQSQSAKASSFLTAESLREIRQKLKRLSDENLYKDDFLTKSTDNKSDLEAKCDSETGQTSFQFFPEQQPENKHTTNSLESRSRLKDTSSTEWHLRRKSYGFEKMSPPDQKSMFRAETSTDSGIGRSGELENWSPTTEAKGTVITFGDNKKSTTVVLHGTNSNKVLVQRRIHQREKDPNEIEIKRHSIAVDESKYVRDNLKRVFDTKTSVHLNGFYPTNMTQEDDTNRRLKRVEFCKTEVHFAAESGRVNIVETDGKPPPTNNFRRRRRSSGNMYIDAISAGMQVMHFGDSEKTTIFEQESESGDDFQLKKSNVTVSIANNDKSKVKPISLAALDDLSATEEQQDEITPRGILKNKPIKPKPYHLGDNIEASDSLWGVKLKPVNSASSTDGDFKPTKPFEDNSSTLNDTEKFTSSKIDSLSVADHVKIVEERRDGTGYSTKINLNLTDKPFTWNSENEIYSLNNNDLTDSSELLTNRIFHTSSNTSTQQQHLKSTSLIMQTIHTSSSNYEFNRTLNQAIGSSTTTAAKLISNMREITKSKSANSIFSAGSDIKSRPKYSSSLDGDYILNNDAIRKSSSFSSNSSTASLNENTLLNVNRMATLEEESKNDLIQKKPVAAPRVKALTTMYLTNGNRHANQKFETCTGNGFDSDDSADEEVKRYLGAESDENIEKFDGKTQIDLNTEVFNSWSRIEANKNAINKFSVSDVPKSNIMSIELKSPESTLRKSNKIAHDKSEQKQATHEFKNITEKKITPTAKPRTTLVVKSSYDDSSESAKSKKTINSSKRPTDKEQTGEPAKLSIPRGARQLREHELSYFGVKTSTETNNKNSTRKLTTTNDINLPNSNKLIEESKFNDIQKWKLTNERPDLLRHSPVERTAAEQPINENYDENIDGPLYENLQKPSSYNRKKDLNRDERILNEMTQTADQTLKTVAENHRIKDEKSKKRTNERNRTTKPLDTISEKQSVRPQRDDELEKKNYMKSTQEFERKCCSRRSSSASSVDSNISSSSSLLRERIRNSQLNSKVSNSKLKGTKINSAAAVIVRHRSERHTSSHDDTSANNSSTENLSKPPQKIERHIRRVSSSNRTTVDDRNSHRRIKSRPITENPERDAKLQSSRENSTKRSPRKLTTDSSRKLHSDSARKSSDDYDGSKYSSRQSSERKRNRETDRESRRSNRSIEHKTKNNSTGYESECLKSHRSSRNEHHLDNHYRSKSSSKADEISKSRRSNRSTDDDKTNLRGSSREAHHKSRSHGTNRSSGGQSVAPIIVNTTTKTIAPSKHRNDKNHVSSQKKDKTKTKI